MTHTKFPWILSTSQVDLSLSKKFWDPLESSRGSQKVLEGSFHPPSPTHQSHLIQVAVIEVEEEKGHEIAVERVPNAEQCPLGELARRQHGIPRNAAVVPRILLQLLEGRPLLHEAEHEDGNGGEREVEDGLV